jgi:hypothetical protein
MTETVAATSLEDQLAQSRAECERLRKQIDWALKALDNPRKVVGDLPREAVHDLAFATWFGLRAMSRV